MSMYLFPPPPTSLDPLSPNSQTRDSNSSACLTPLEEQLLSLPTLVSIYSYLQELVSARNENIFIPNNKRDVLML